MTLAEEVEEVRLGASMLAGGASAIAARCVTREATLPALHTLCNFSSGLSCTSASVCSSNGLGDVSYIACMHDVGTHAQRLSKVHLIFTGVGSSPGGPVFVYGRSLI